MSEAQPPAVVETAPTRAHTFATAFEAAIAAADEERARLAEAGDLDALAHAVPQLDQLKRSLGTLRDAVGKNVIDLLNGARTYVLDGEGIFEVFPGAPKKEWDTMLLLQLLLSRALHAPGVEDDLNEARIVNSDGEVVCSLYEIEQRLLDWLQPLPLTKSCGWRSGELAKRGVDASNYRRMESGRPRLVFTSTAIEGSDDAADS